VKQRRTLATLVSVTVLGLAAPVAAADTATARKAGDQSLVEVLQADGNRFDRNGRDFDILHRAVTTVLAAKPDSAVAVLADGTQALTAFAPTDRAFKRLARQLTGRLVASEQKTFKRLAANVDVATLEAVLLYHVVPGATVTFQQARGSDDASLDTAAGLPVKVNVRGHRVFLRDRDFSDRNPRVVRALSDINEGNMQIAHGIDRVLRPADLP
jgi:uncharacterized surface protein with fasciclin (FAS1) repeats